MVLIVEATLEVPAMLVPDVLESLSRSGEDAMRVESRVNDAQKAQAIEGTIDVSLRGTPEATALAVPVDQIMFAVDGVHRYVVSHLSRIGRACDADDVMQDVRVAVWDGVTRGRYRQLPGVPFGAWVQGVCANVCAAHIRRELSHQTFPLLMEPADADGSASFDTLAILGIGGVDRSAEKIIDQDWARTIIELTRESLPAGVWKLAVDSLTGPRQYGPPSPQDRRRWHAVTVVRQTARTVQNALDVDHAGIRNIGDVCQCAAECLPTPVLRRTAASIVRPGVSGPARTKALAALAAELGVTERYVAVQIGFARRLYQTSWRILQAGRRPAL
ncbi:sigma factor [Arthrobacter sp. UYCo732]|uniref:RNA polymerase sigma factor n=1 Tax=Arthrobacter sp. UYCo732 TaxID=3156336 RepID=UPI00339B112A